MIAPSDRRRAPVLARILSCLAAILLFAVPATAQTNAANPWFTVDAINPGLPDAPVLVDRETPRSTLETLLFLAERENWDTAAHLLDVSAYAEADQRTVGATRAEDLAMLIDRRIVVNWDALPDRPDGLNANAGSDNPTAGLARRSISLGLVDLQGRPLSIRLNRVTTENGDPVWIFSEQTVANLPALAAQHGPTTFERMLPGWLKTRPFWSLYFWEILLFPVLVLVAAAFGYAAHLAMTALRSRLSGIAAKLAASLRGPVTLGVVVTVLTIGAGSFLTFSGVVDAVLSPLLTLGYIAAILWGLVSFADTFLDYLLSFEGDDLTAVGPELERKRSLATKVAAARRFAIVVTVIAGAGIVLSQARILGNLGVSLVAGAGVLTLVLGYAARDVLANIMASLQISLNQSAQIGDKVMFDGYLCTVELIHFTYVQLRIWTGERLVVPVSEFVETAFENWTMTDPTMVKTISIKLHSLADIDAMRDRYNAILDEIEEGLDPDTDRGVHVEGQDALGMNVLFKVPCQDPNTAWTIACDVRERLVAAAADLDSDDHPVLPRGAAAEAG